MDSANQRLPLFPEGPLPGQREDRSERLPKLEMTPKLLCHFIIKLEQGEKIRRELECCLREEATGHAGVKKMCFIPPGLFIIIGSIRSRVSCQDNGSRKKSPACTLREEKMGKSANTQIWTESGIKLVLTNKKEAMVFFRQAIKLSPKNATGFFERGVSYQTLQKHEQAIREYDQAIELDPQNVQAYFNRGVAHQTLGNPEKAVQDFKRVVEIKPDYAQAYLNRGKALRQLMQFKQALADFKIAARLGDLDAQSILDSMGISWKT